MGTLKRRSRQRIDSGDVITRAWDAGDAPPPPAFDPENRELVGDCVFFRWAEAPGRYHGSEHPQIRAWLDALRSSKQPEEREPGCSL